MEALRTEWCEEHFSHASETPLANEKWRRDIDLLREGDTVARILAG